MNRSDPLYQAHDAEIRDTFSKWGFVTGSDEMVSLMRRACKAASVSDVTILLEGETGTGKGVLARTIHQLDQKRRSFPFITVNCSTITEALAESELFGHYRGAFTGAVSYRRGLFHCANHGTIFLDDINDLPLEVQPKLLDVIQRGIVRPMGCDREMTLDVRIIAACNRPLRPLVVQNRFRSDLYHRLNVIQLYLPPLRERPHDLPVLVLALARRYSALYEPIRNVEPELVSFLRTQPFSGNIRELENSIQRVLFGKSQGTSLTLEDWQRQAADGIVEDRRDSAALAAQNLWEAISTGGLPFVQALRQIERHIIEAALQAGGLTRREIAKRLRTSERTLYHKMRAYRLGHHTKA
jgi:transcriptional regulator with PAS, ATPase and Fis domain